MIVATSTEPTFLYPKSRQFPFDEVCEQIVRALEERNWDVPGINVEFDIYGSGAEKYRMVRKLSGKDFKLRFCRVQANMGRWNDTAAVTEILIPQKELHVYDDESGPTYYIYVGKNWESDKQDFFLGSKVNSKLVNKPRTYLMYKGGWDGRYIYRNQRPPYLLHDSDLDREYKPKQGEPRSFSTDDVFTEFTRWLEGNLLSMILAQPVPSERTDLFHKETTPFPETMSPIFCFGESRDASRVYKGKNDLTELTPEEQFGMDGGGYRLIALGNGDGNVPDIAYDGFKWCGFGEVVSDTPIHVLDVPGHYRWPDREKFLFRVTPNRADGVYVADHAVYERRRKELSDAVSHGENPERDFTKDEVRDFNSARGRTIVPITEYDGSYEQPIVLINREIDLEEVELVSGPWPEFQYISLIMNRSAEARGLFEQAMSAEDAYCNSGFTRASHDKTEEAHKAAIEQLATYFDGDAVLISAADVYSRQVLRKVEMGVKFIERLISAAYESRSLGLI